MKEHPGLPKQLTSEWINGTKSYRNVTEDIYKQISGKAPRAWKIAIFISGAATLIGSYALYKTFWYGIGMWGENKTVNWAWDITSFVWWIGIGHAGTLISAILLLFRAYWRNSINRAAEAMTLFAVTCSGLYIMAHLGRVWLVYWIFPIPNTYGPLWVNWNSALVWDAFAVGTYLIVSIVFWYHGLIPDMALIRDRAPRGWQKRIYSFLSLGWNGSARKWHRYESVTKVLAGWATALVISVHSIVGMDFATGIIPGWHSTFFPPYFVAGAVLSGFAMVLTLMLVAREVMDLKAYITIRHIENMNKIIIFMGGTVTVAYMTEYFMSWYSGMQYEQATLIDHVSGEYAWVFYSMMLCNVITPQLFWVKKIRTSVVASFLISIIINIGMWLERFDIVVSSLHKDYLPSSWAMFYPTIYDVGVFVFSMGLFFTLFLLFVRYMPVVSISEVKSLLKPLNKAPLGTGEPALAEDTQPHATGTTLEQSRGIGTTRGQP